MSTEDLREGLMKEGLEDVWLRYHTVIRKCDLDDDGYLTLDELVMLFSVLDSVHIPHNRSSRHQSTIYRGSRRNTRGSWQMSPNTSLRFKDSQEFEVLPTGPLVEALRKMEEGHCRPSRESTDQQPLSVQELA